MADFEGSTVSHVLPEILKALAEGDEVSSRNGRVKELLNQQIVLQEPWRREVLCQGRGANIYAQIAETMWVLAGRNDVTWLSAYLPRAPDYSDDGIRWRAGYGPRIRDFAGTDQLARVVETLRADPLTRQAVVQIWDVTDGNNEIALKDRACNTQLQFLSRQGRLHLTVTVRSNDAMWGWSGINAFEWSTLQEIVASLLGINVGSLTFNIGSLHLYEQHWGKARSIRPVPGFFGESLKDTRFNPDRTVTSLGDVDRMLGLWFAWEDKCRKGTAYRSHLDQLGFDPMFKAWASVIAYYWSRDSKWLYDLKGTALAAAVFQTPSSLLPDPVRPPVSTGQGVTPGAGLEARTRAFYRYVADLHAKKHASYGDSWKKRGEQLSILPNMARKVDRLGVGDEYDSSADTLIDLLVYTLKYECWLAGVDQGPENVNQRLGYYLGETEEQLGRTDDIPLVVRDFNEFCDRFDDHQHADKLDFADMLARHVAPIARDAWAEEDQYKGADHE